MDIALALLVLSAAGTVFLADYTRGWIVGVRQTEERWSQAVSKAEWNRKCGGA